MNLIYTLILAILLDQWLGEPKKYHPLVFFGRWASYLESLLRKPNNKATTLKYYGLLAVMVLLIPLTGVVYLISQWQDVYFFIAPIILYFCIATKSLKQHANAVLIALNANDMPLAKQRLAMMVSRQTDTMTADEVRRATIESVLENGVDAIFSPIFWFIVAGPAGAILYRLSNTLDAMWGYKNQRYLYFGWAAARLDDVLNWLPARLTASSYILLGNSRQAISCWRQQAHLLDSPNAGVVMTTGAGALNLRLGGRAWYHGECKDKIFFGTQNRANNHDIHRANTLVEHTIFLWIVVLFVGHYVLSL